MRVGDLSVVLETPGESRPDVVVFGLEPVEPLQLPRPVELRLLDELQHDRRLRVPDRLVPPRGPELLGGVLADRLEHREAWLAVGVVGHDSEAPPHQRVERVEVAAADRLDRLEPCAAREHGEAGEQALLVGLEQLVAPVDRRPQRLLTSRSVGGAADEEGEPLVEPFQDRLRRQEPDARGRQLDGERQAVESCADRGDDRRRLRVDREARLDSAGPGLEQLGRLARREGLERVLLLSGDAEGGPAREDEPRAVGRGGQPREQPRGRWHQMLDVVELAGGAPPPEGAAQ